MRNIITEEIKYRVHKFLINIAEEHAWRPGLGENSINGGSIYKVTGNNEFEDFEYVDNWFGGEPYSGMTTISFKGKVIWVFQYAGRVIPGADKKQIYEILGKSLNRYDSTFPIRGPKEIGYDLGNGWGFATYMNKYGGNIENFKGIEKIFIYPKNGDLTPKIRVNSDNYWKYCTETATDNYLKFYTNYFGQFVNYL